MPISDNGVTTVVSRLQIGQDANAVLLKPNGSGSLSFRNVNDSSDADIGLDDVTLDEATITTLTATTGTVTTLNSTTGTITNLTSTSFVAATVKPTSPVITAGSGTGITVNNVGEVRRLVYKVTATYAAFSAVALTADKTIATLPAKTRLVGIIADCTVAFSGGTVDSATVKVGSSAGGTQFIAEADVFTAPATYGLLDAELGTTMTRAAAIQSGALPSWTGTTTVNARITTTTANTDQLTAGSITFYLTCEVYP